MSRKPNLELDQKVYEALKGNNFKQQREIAKKFNLSVGTVNKIKQRVEAALSGKPQKKKKRKQSKRTIRKLQKAAVGNQMMKQSQIIVNNVIDVLSGMKYSIKNLEEMQDKYSREDHEMINELKELNLKIDDLLEISVEEPASVHQAELRIKQKLELIQKIDAAVFKAGDYFRRDTLRIKAIQELRKQFETFVNMEIVAKGISQVKELITVFFQATAVLDDKSYIRLRDKAIELNPVVRGLFIDHETEVDEFGKPEEAQIIYSD
jgi:transposase